MNDEKLIEYVRQFTALYDHSDPKYMDPRFKTRVWEEIGGCMGATGTQCKSRWTNIRDQFKRHINKRQGNSGQISEIQKRYKYEELLQFILPFVSERRPVSLSNICYEESNQRNQDHEPGETDEPEIEIQEIENEPLFTPTSNFDIPKPKLLKRKHVVDTSSSILMKYIIENHTSKQQNPPDDIDAFLASIATSLRKLSPYHQHLAKGRIFKVVHDLEFQNLQNVPSCSTSVESPQNIVEDTSVSNCS